MLKNIFKILTLIISCFVILAVVPAQPVEAAPAGALGPMEVLGILIGLVVTGGGIGGIIGSWDWISSSWTDDLKNFFAAAARYAAEDGKENAEAMAKYGKRITVDDLNTLCKKEFIKELREKTKEGIDKLNKDIGKEKDSEKKEKLQKDLNLLEKNKDVADKLEEFCKSENKEKEWGNMVAELVAKVIISAIGKNSNPGWPDDFFNTVVSTEWNVWTDTIFEKEIEEAVKKKIKNCVEKCVGNSTNEDIKDDCEDDCETSKVNFEHDIKEKIKFKLKMKVVAGLNDKRKELSKEKDQVQEINDEIEELDTLIETYSSGNNKNPEKVKKAEEKKKKLEKERDKLKGKGEKELEKEQCAIMCRNFDCSFFHNLHNSDLSRKEKNNVIDALNNCIRNEVSVNGCSVSDKIKECETIGYPINVADGLTKLYLSCVENALLIAKKKPYSEYFDTTAVTKAIAKKIQDKENDKKTDKKKIIVDELKREIKKLKEKLTNMLKTMKHDSETMKSELSKISMSYREFIFENELKQVLGCDIKAAKRLYDYMTKYSNNMNDDEKKEMKKEINKAIKKLSEEINKIQKEWGKNWKNIPEEIYNKWSSFYEKRRLLRKILSHHLPYIQVNKEKQEINTINLMIIKDLSQEKQTTVKQVLDEYSDQISAIQNSEIPLAQDTDEDGIPDIDELETEIRYNLYNNGIDYAYELRVEELFGEEVYELDNYVFLDKLVLEFEEEYVAPTGPIVYENLYDPEEILSDEEIEDMFAITQSEKTIASTNWILGIKTGDDITSYYTIEEGETSENAMLIEGGQEVETFFKGKKTARGFVDEATNSFVVDETTNIETVWTIAHWASKEPLTLSRALEETEEIGEDEIVMGNYLFCPPSGSCRMDCTCPTK